MSLRKPLSLLLLILALATACHREEKAEPKPQNLTSPVSANKPGVSTPTPSAPQLNSPSDAIKTFFNAISKEQYDIAWSSLSKTSQDKFIKMVAEDEKLDTAKVRDLFEQNQMPIRLGFWRSFRNSSKIDTFAPEATYKVLNQGPDQTEVEMTSGTVTLKCKAIHEGDQWKMGYAETFLP